MFYIAGESAARENLFMSIRSFSRFVLLFLCCFSYARTLAQSPHFASDAIPKDRRDAYSDLAVRWMQEYLRVDTTNPPGNEARATAFFHKIFAAEGIEDKTFEYLEKSYAARESRLTYLKGDPLLKNLESDPRHTAFLKKMKLPLD